MSAKFSRVKVTVSIVNVSVFCQVLYLREVNRFLALVCLVKEENFKKHGLIDYNFHCFRYPWRRVSHLWLFRMRQAVLRVYLGCLVYDTEMSGCGAVVSHYAGTLMPELSAILLWVLTCATRVVCSPDVQECHPGSV